MDDCNFCLVNDRLKGEILARNDLCYLVDNGDPVLRHAGMVIPYRHVASPLELNTDEWLATHKLLHQAIALYDAQNPDGYNIGWNVGQAAGQHFSTKCPSPTSCAGGVLWGRWPGARAAGYHSRQAVGELGRAGHPRASQNTRGAAPHRPSPPPQENKH